MHINRQKTINVSLQLDAQLGRADAHPKRLWLRDQTHRHRKKVNVYTISLLAIFGTRLIN